MSSYKSLYQEATTALKVEHNIERARTTFLKAAKLQNLPLDQWNIDAEKLLETGDVKAASELLLQIIKANPTDIQALLGLTRASIFLGMYDEAEAYVSAVLKMEPNHPEALTYQGLVFESREAFQDALDSLNKAAELAPDLFATHFNLGRILLQIDELAPAIAALSHATERNPNSYEAFYILGIAYHNANLLKESIISFNRALELAPENIDIYATLADVLVEAGDKETAMQILNAGLNASDEHPALLEKSAAICMQEGKIANAVEYFEKIVEKMPDYEQAWINLANLYVLMEDLEKSEHAAKRAIEINPEGWEGCYQLGNLYEAVKLFDQAETEYRKAVQNAPDEEYRPLGNLGALLIEMDDPQKNQEAIHILQQTIAKVPKGEYRFHYNLALSYAKLGEKGAAQHLIKQIQAEADPNDDILEATNALENNVFSVQEQVKMNISLGGAVRPIDNPAKKKEQ